MDAVGPAADPPVEPAPEPAVGLAADPPVGPAEVDPAVEPVPEPAVEPPVEPVPEPAVEPPVEPAEVDPAAGMGLFDADPLGGAVISPAAGGSPSGAGSSGVSSVAPLIVVAPILPTPGSQPPTFDDTLNKWMDEVFDLDLLWLYKANRSADPKYHQAETVEENKKHIIANLRRDTKSFPEFCIRYALLFSQKHLKPGRTIQQSGSNRSVDDWCANSIAAELSPSQIKDAERLGFPGVGSQLTPGLMWLLSLSK